MSRSTRHTPVFGIACCNSEKKDRTICNRKMRRRAKHLLFIKDSDEFLMPLQEEVMDIWSMGRDGKHYWTIRPYNPCQYYPSTAEEQLEDLKKSMRK